MALIRKRIDKGFPRRGWWLPMTTTTDPQRLAEVRRLCRTGLAKHLRLVNELSLAEVAAPIGVSPSSVWRWERGERTPRGEDAVRYLDVLESLKARS